MAAEKRPGRVRSERREHVLEIRIDNAERRNAFTPEMMRELSDVLTELDRDDARWVGVLCAEGDHFTAGLDMPKFFGPGATAQPLPAENVDPFGLVRSCRKPIVSAVQGITFTVGIEMMLAGDLAVAADNVRFCQMEAKRGIAPLGGAHFRFLSRMGWGDAMYHLLLCDEFGAAEALRIGLVNEVVPAAELIPRAEAIAAKIIANAPLAVQYAMEAVNHGLDMSLADGLFLEATLFAVCCATEDKNEGTRAFLEKRQAQFKGR